MIATILRALVWVAAVWVVLCALFVIAWSALMRAANRGPDLQEWEEDRGEICPPKRFSAKEESEPDMPHQDKEAA